MIKLKIISCHLVIKWNQKLKLNKYNSSVFQLFAIAYHQCRWNYNDQDDVKKWVLPVLMCISKFYLWWCRMLELGMKLRKNDSMLLSFSVDANMDSFDIPYDVIWLDIEHTNGKRWVQVWMKKVWYFRKKLSKTYFDYEWHSDLTINPFYLPQLVADILPGMHTSSLHLKTW